MSKFLQSLTESKLIPSTASYKKYTGKQIAELTYLHLIGLHILVNEPISEKWAKDYAMRSARVTSFAHWYQSGTDLMLLLYALTTTGDIEFRSDESSKDFIDGLYFDEPTIRLWLKNVGHDEQNKNLAKKLFLTLDTQFKIKDSSFKAVRRLAMDWNHLTLKEQRLTLTRLLQFMRARARGSDILHQLEIMAKAEHLEMKDVCNPETGEGCGSEGSHTEKKKGGSWLGKLAGAAGLVAGYQLAKKLSEDDGGAATTAGDIAPYVKPLGAVHRRNPKPKSRKTK